MMVICKLKKDGQRKVRRKREEEQESPQSNGPQS